MALKVKISHLENQVQTLSAFSTDTHIIRGQLNLKVERYAQKVINYPAFSNEEKNQLIQILKNCRLKLIYPIMAYDDEDYSKYGKMFNILPFISSSLQSPAFESLYLLSQNTPLYCYRNTGEFPKRSCSFFDFRLDSEAISKIPQEVLAAAGNLEGKEVDLFFSVFDSTRLPNESGVHVNFSLHGWMHRHEISGCDVKNFVEIGLYQPFGFYLYEGQDGLPFNQLRWEEVYTHSVDGAMATSPNNMRLWKDPYSPFASGWIVAKTENRILISKIITLFNLDPDAETFAASVGEAFDEGQGNSNSILDSIAFFQDSLPEAIIEVFDPLRDALNSNKWKSHFENLPHPFKQGICKYCNFESDTVTNAQREDAVETFIRELIDQIALEPARLLSAHTLPRANHAYPLMQCAQYFLEEKPNEGFEFFSTMDEELQKAVYFSMWELQSCKRESDVGKRDFENLEISNFQKARALMLAASRQKDLYIPQSFKDNSTKKPEELIRKMLKLIDLNEFSELSISSRKEILDPYLECVTQKKDIYEQVYWQSLDPSKGGDSWGEQHYADDLNVLKNILNNF